MKSKLYIINFGDSAKFRVSSDDTREDFEKSKLVVDLENELNDYLKSKLPESNYTYYTTPTILEVEPEDAEKYADYPELDAKAIEAVKATLLTEVQNMQDNRLDNSDAPYSNVN